MGIFRQNMHFSNVLVVWRARARVLTVCGVTCKMAGSLRGLNCNFLFL
jgi:hypothetical protein